MKQLRGLWVGMNRRPLTDAGVRHLAGLAGLEALDLQGAKMTDAGVGSLAGLSELHRLYVQGAEGAGGITDAGVDHVLRLTKLREQQVANGRLTEAGARRLLGLASLRRVSLSGAELTMEQREGLKRLRPDVELY
jgi:hypothetical protein